ncbi:MAG: nuclear transport factor 2 family protein [Firmicutes bacterium]|nr:nuclear transport factor 2 family protein [Alicyclobacillaceae bacterium]MCL6497013.1 nuclear transport factor 2 family protein [Bacillota bacterium]
MTDAESQELEGLRRAVAELSQRVSLMEDREAIRALQYKYGYYLDKCLYEEVVALFSPTGEVRFMGGIFKGTEGVRRLYCGRFRERHGQGRDGPNWGYLLDHPQLQGVIDVDPDGRRARARFRSLMQAGRHVLAPGETRQWWEGGIYENEYVKEDGIWKIRVLDYRTQWQADYASGWAHTPPNSFPFYSVTYPDDPLGPDELMDPHPALWPDTEVVPFHYPHPVTGQRWTPRERPAPPRQEA